VVVLIKNVNVINKIFFMIIYIYMLSFNKNENSRPIAMTSKHNKIIYINTNIDSERRKDIELSDYMPEDDIIDIFRNNKKKMSKIDMIKLEKSLLKNDQNIEDEGLSNLYGDLNKKLENKINKEIILKDYDDSIEILPNDKSERIYYCGPTGAGKSHSMGQYIKNFKKVFPKKRIILFSDQPKDEVLDQFKPIRIIINEELLDDPIDVEELKDSLVIFDDIDSITNKKLKNLIETLRDTILKRGRHFEIYALCSNHQCTEYRQTRELLSASNIIYFYPQSGATYSIKYVLNKYIGLDKAQIDKIFKLKSRWVAIHKQAPMYVMYSHGIYLLN
jgi:hypothetical protein